MYSQHSKNSIKVSVSIHCKISCNEFLQNPGGRLNKKDGLTRYGDSHVKDKTS